MTFLPIVERELRVMSRRRLTFWSRSGSALVALLAGAAMYFGAEAAVWPSLFTGPSVFTALAWMAFLHCLAAGPRLTADCLSEERREGTLGLLFLTDLKGYDIVLGKLAATSLNACYGLLAVVPILAVSILMGGVSAGQLWRTVLVLAASLTFSLTAGLFCSLWCTRGRRAASWTSATVASVVLLPFVALMIWMEVTHFRGPPTTAMAWLVVSPALALGLATQPPTQFAAGGSLFVASVGIAGGLSLAFLTLTSLLLPRRWADRPASATRLRWRARCRRLLEGTPERRAAFRRRLLEANPFFWLSARDRLKPAYVWGFLVLTVAVWFVSDLIDPGAGEDTAFLAVVSLAVHASLKVWMAFVAVLRIAEDRRSGALELLLATPLKVADLVRGQFLALTRQFGGPCLAVVAADAVFCGAVLRSNGAEPVTSLLLYGTHILLLPLDAFAIGLLGLWAAVRSPQATKAAASVVFRVLVLPWLAFLLLVSATSYLTLRYRWRWEPTENLAILVWFAMGFVNALAFALFAWHRLRTRFRSAAAERVGRRRGWWGAWLNRE